MSVLGADADEGRGAQVVLFDVMDTVVVDPFFDGIEAFFGCERAALLRAIAPGLWPRFETGELDSKAFYRGMFRDGRSVDGPALEAYLATRYRYIDGVEALLAGLAQRAVPMAALSNYPVWYEIVDDALGLSRYLDAAHVSYRTGVRKPDAEAYLGACRRLRIAPGAALFVDDREENCAAAAALGLRTHRFDGAAGLAFALDRHGLLPAPRRSI